MKISTSMTFKSNTCLGLLVLITFIIGCDTLLDVSNPNSLTQENIDSPSTAEGLKNGLLNSLMVGTAFTYASVSTISDEVYWTGSYESYKTYNEGRIDFPNNEITVGGFPEISQARYMADLAIEQLREYEQNGELEDPSVLARVYIYSAVTRITIADSYDNFVFSEPQEAAPAIGEENMYELYDQAINHAAEAINISRNLGNSILEMQALGIRARAKHAKGVWGKLNPKSDVSPADPLVTGTGATADAEAALNLMDTDYKAQFNYLGPLVLNYFAEQVNQRGEITPINTETVVEGGVTYDPIIEPKTGEVDPRFQEIRADFTDNQTYSEIYPPLTWLSWSEMHLIIAEEAVGTDASKAREHLNTVRDIYNLPNVQADDNLEKFIEHERRANLYLQGRRLNDMYRFGSTSPAWLPDEDALQEPGTLLPIPSNETLANPEV